VGAQLLENLTANRVLSGQNLSLHEFDLQFELVSFGFPFDPGVIELAFPVFSGLDDRTRHTGLDLPQFLENGGARGILFGFVVACFPEAFEFDSQPAPFSLGLDLPVPAGLLDTHFQLVAHRRRHPRRVIRTFERVDHCAFDGGNLRTEGITLLGPPQLHGSEFVFQLPL
jgi:hypothetical protein